MITHDGPDRRYQLCRCSDCGLEERCTPVRDFYVWKRKGSGEPLICTDCFQNRLHNEGVKLPMLVSQKWGQA